MPDLWSSTTKRELRWRGSAVSRMALSFSTASCRRTIGLLCVAAQSARNEARISTVKSRRHGPRVRPLPPSPPLVHRPLVGAPSADVLSPL